MFALKTKQVTTKRERNFCKAYVSSGFFKMALGSRRRSKENAIEAAVHKVHAGFPSGHTSHRSQQRKEVGNEIKKRFLSDERIQNFAN